MFTITEINGGKKMKFTKKQVASVILNYTYLYHKIDITANKLIKLNLRECLQHRL